jgi:hypothetical protein
VTGPDHPRDRGASTVALLALGAAPAMVDITGEAGPMAGAASGVLVSPIHRFHTMWSASGSRK